MCNIPDSVLEQLRSDVSEIKVALLGNEYNPAGGLLCRTSEIEKELLTLKARYDRMIWTVAGGAGILTVLFNLLMQLWDKIVIN